MSEMDEALKIVLRQVEGFHEELGIDPEWRERVIHAVEGAALRGYRLGLQDAGANTHGFEESCARVFGGVV